MGVQRQYSGTAGRRELSGWGIPGLCQRQGKDPAGLRKPKVILFLGITIFVLSVSIYVTLGLAAALVVFVLPTVIATNFFFRMAFRPRDQKRGCLVMFFSVPCTALAILITASFLVDFGRADAGTGPLSVILHVPFAFVSVIAAISGSTIAWRSQWKIRWQVILASYATMGAFVAILFRVF